MKATQSSVPEQPKLKFNLVSQTDLLISTVLLASRQQAIKHKCGHLNFSQIRILAMQTYVPSSRHMRFPERSNDTLQGKSLSVLLQVLILTAKCHHLRKARLFPRPCIFFFLDRCLGLKCCSDSRCLSRFSACVQEQKEQCPVFPQYGNCYSCRDPPFFATSLNSYFLSRNHSHVCRVTHDAYISLQFPPSLGIRFAQVRKHIWLFITFI